MDITLIISGGLLLGCLIAISWFAGSDAPYIPTRLELIKQVLQAAGVKEGKKFYELGSGDGRVVFQAAKLGANSTGIEQSLLRVFYSKYRAKKLALHPRGVNVEFYHDNIFNRSYRDADILFIYLLPKGVLRLEDKLRKELKKNSTIITQTYHFKNWRPYKKIIPPKNIDLTGDIKGAGNFYLYRV